MPDRSAPDWHALRREFPATQSSIYLDIGRKAILPRSVVAAAQEWFERASEGSAGEAFSMSRVEETRRSVAALYGAPARNIAFVKNTSEGINIVAQGYRIEPGDNVLVSRHEHICNLFPWRHLIPRGVEIRTAAPEPSGRVTVDCYRKLIDARTRILSVAWVAHGNGHRADIPALAELCRARGIRLVVDGIQAVGVLATPIVDLGADVVAAGGHKAQLGLAGAGLLYVSDEMIPQLSPPYASMHSFTSNDPRQEQPELASDAHRFEYGNPNYLGIWIQRAAAELLAQIGLGNIERRVRELTTHLIERAERAGIGVATPRPWSERAGIVSFEIAGDPEAIAAGLVRRGIMLSVRKRYVRASVHFYNTHEELDRLVDVLAASLSA